jgi:hypothetical protein
MEIKINPEYEKLMPAQDKATIKGIFESIKATGVRDPIDVNSSGTILDGHTRFRICQKLGIKPAYRVMKFSNIFEEQEYVIRANGERRHMNTIQKVQLYLRKKVILKQAAKQNMSLGGKGVKVYAPLGRITEWIGREAGCSSRTVEKIEFIQEQGSTGLIEKVSAGKVKVERGYAIARQELARRKLISDSKTQLYTKDNCKNGAKVVSFRLIEADISLPNTLNKFAKESANLLLTDPPYAEADVGLFAHMARFADRVLKPHGSFITMFGQGSLPIVINSILQNSSLKFHWILCLPHTGKHCDRIWQKRIVAGWKPLLWFTKGDVGEAQIPNFMWDVLPSNLPEKVLHDWEQGTNEAEYIIRHLTLPGDMVMDCLCGSGTNGVSAIKLGRNFIGMDIESSVLELSRARIRLALADNAKSDSDVANAVEDAASV